MTVCQWVSFKFMIIIRPLTIPRLNYTIKTAFHINTNIKFTWRHVLFVVVEIPACNINLHPISRWLYFFPLFYRACHHRSHLFCTVYVDTGRGQHVDTLRWADSTWITSVSIWLLRWRTIPSTPAGKSRFHPEFYRQLANVGHKITLSDSDGVSIIRTYPFFSQPMVRGLADLNGHVNNGFKSAKCRYLSIHDLIWVGFSHPRGDRILTAYGLWTQ